MMKYKAVILVVEDEPIIRFNAVELLNLEGFEALGARNADEAISILEARSDIHLVFTDVEMPGTMDGIKLTHYIRSRWPEVHLFVASGKTRVNEKDLPEGSKFFPKPYNDHDIIHEMKRVLGAGEATATVR